MNWRTTGWLCLAAAILGLFILAIERPARLARSRSNEPALVVPPFDAALIQSFQLTTASNHVHLVRSNIDWELATPQRPPARSQLADDFLRQVGLLRGRSVLTTAELRSRPQATADFGLNPPTLTLTLAGRSNKIELLVGSRSVSGNQIYYQVVGVPGIFLTDAALFDRLPLVPDHWRDPTLVPIDRLAFDRIRVTAEGGAFTLARNTTGAVWELVEPRPARADAERVNVLLQQLGFLQALRFLASTSAPPLELAGLKPPRVALTLAKGGKEVFQLTVGAPITNSTGLYGQRTGESDILVLPAEAFDLLRIPYQQFLDRRILRFAPDGVSEIEITGLENIRLQRQGTTWRLQPGDASADAGLVARLLAQLGSLEIVDVAKEVVTDVDLPNYGLAPPATRVVLRPVVGDTNRMLASLEIGATRESRVFARVPGEPPVYSLYPSDLQEMPTRAWKLRDRSLWRFDPALVSALTVQQTDMDWSIRRQGTNDWVVPAGWKNEVNPFALEEALFRLSQARAVRLVGEGDVAGLGTTNGPKVLVEFRATPPIPPLRLSFGKRSPAGNRYGAITLTDGSRFTFELPGSIFDNLWREIGLSDPAAPNPP
ncbi:MAG: DUF4340 domain-containing protein [Verrucomicrobiales bacterium]|nr:DUF4340 domain-containing protein [Verrucomicrobiales bacterium]